jgi:hypothetical protein
MTFELVGVGVTIVGAVLATSWRLATKLATVETKLDHIRERVDRLELPHIAVRQKAKSRP